MKRTSLPATLAAALLVVLALVAGCGSSGSTADRGADRDEGSAADASPTDASVEEFCGAFMDLIQQATEVGDGLSDAEAVELAKQTADKLAAIGTPEDIPAEAREAFELAIEKIRAIPEGATRKELDAIAGDLSTEQDQNLDALTTYVTNKCLALALPTDGSS